MKVLHIIASVNPAGGGPIEGVIRESLFAHSKSGAQREILSLDPPDAPWVTGCPVPVHAMGGLSYVQRHGRARFLPWVRYGFSGRYVRWLQENSHQYEGIVINGLWNFTTMGFAWAMRSRSPNFVLYTHGMLDPWFRRTYPVKAFVKQLLWPVADGVLVNSAKAVLFTSEDERRLARGAFLPYRANERVVAYGAAEAPDDADGQTREFRKAVPALDGRRYLLFMGRLHPKKGCDLLVEAFAEIARRYPEIDLVVAGPDQTGIQAVLRARARALNVDNRIHWPGMLRGAAKWGAFRGAEALVLPSHQENFGIVVAEAMACGTPALITNKVNIWREVLNSGGGLVEPDTLEGVGSLLERYLGLGAEARSKLRRGAREGYERHFSIPGAANDLENVLREATGVEQ